MRERARNSFSCMIAEVCCVWLVCAAVCCYLFQLESETLEIARKIAEARFRTSNYTMQQPSQQQSPAPQWQASQASAGVASFPSRSPTSNSGAPLHATRSSPMPGSHSPRTAARFGSPSPAGPSSRAKAQPAPEISGFYSAHLLAKKY